jgi:hypothetical protein
LKVAEHIKTYFPKEGNSQPLKPKEAQNNLYLQNRRKSQQKTSQVRECEIKRKVREDKERRSENKRGRLKSESDF